MKIENMPFTQIDWTSVEAVEHTGTTGYATWKTVNLGDIRIRMVEYSWGYSTNKWCDKGHIIYCVDGGTTIELKNGKKFILRKGMTYVFGDNADSHRNFTDKGARLLIID